jgi:hypothetical protein
MVGSGSDVLVDITGLGRPWRCASVRLLRPAEWCLIKQSTRKSLGWRMPVSRNPMEEV